MALTEEQLEVFGERMAALYQDFERAVIGDIARRLLRSAERPTSEERMEHSPSVPGAPQCDGRRMKSGRLTESAELMVSTLREKGWSTAQIYEQVMRELNMNEYWQREMAENTLAVKRELQSRIEALREATGQAAQELCQEAGVMAFRSDLAVWKQAALPVRGSAFERVVQTMAGSLTEELTNLTKSTGFRLSSGATVKTREVYARAVNNAFVKMTSGAYSYGQAIEEGVRELARSGIRTVDFESGVSRQADTAVRNAVLTASAQLAGQITMQNAEETGVNYVEVSSHAGAREGDGHANHRGWQGKVYRIEGSDAEYANLEEATGYPSDPAGLCGYNCRHSFYPFWPGISERTPMAEEPGPVTVNGREYSYYQATQEQRRREREIRALKREANAFEDAGKPARAKAVRAQIREKTARYKDFSEAAGIRAKTERLRVGKYGELVKKESTGAYTGAKKTDRWEERHAERFYEEVRNRKPYVDAAKIARYTRFSEDEIEDIRQHVFIRLQPLDNGKKLERFAPDFDQAQAWQRLTEGRGSDLDKMLLEHEYLELTEMRTHGYNYDEGHAIANAKYDWWSAHLEEQRRKDK